MPLRISEAGNRLSTATGIYELMDDLGHAMTGPGAGKMRMLGGGAPAAIPAAQEVWRRRLAELLADPDQVDQVLGVYDAPAGSPAFRKSVADCFRRELGWDITEQNVAVTAGGQAAFFQLFTLLGDATQPIALPISPEYIGYADQGTQPGLFRSHRPKIEEIGPHDFKYHVDFENLDLSGAGAVCVSRPTNPSGNVLSDHELARLTQLAKAEGCPLIVDNAYGQPFPGAIFTQASPPPWDHDTILVYSLSKLGLPGTRTGVVIASEEIARRVAAMTAVVGLANNNTGQAIVGPLLDSGEALTLSRDVIKPFYQERAKLAREILAEAFGDAFPYRVHLTEGAFFLWLWLPELPIGSRELYERLKRRDVLVVPGDYFFYGLPEGDSSSNEWPHRRQCLRLTFSQSEQTVREALEIMAEELRALHG
ncbi:valine--pyruvate transaminase [Posidoniimonas polymericola]|nr:valine--pyruvate transaminase [Posidoniimonas polymericola]